MRDDLMVQQQVDNVWQHMVGVICLNQVNRLQTKPVLTRLFNKYPTAHSLLRSCTIPMLEELLEPLGMQRVRAKRIYKMSIQIENWDGVDATDLYGIGKYGSDSYNIFYLNNIPTGVQDKELKRYIAEELV
jgi:methyl-CpG-binding domain protein 4|tara:strand:- start:2951 stop:3343 length:393 start_codon:yes stop_codon:yes gene_type:complete